VHATIHEATVTLTCTLAELQGMATMPAAIYATPMPNGQAHNVYLSTHGHFKYDFVLATLEDFEAELGLAISPDDEIDEDQGQETVTITVPRQRRPDDA
jgi:hypothetical protein